MSLTAERRTVRRATLLRRLETKLRAGRRILLVGSEGAGKTSLIRDLATRYPILIATSCAALGQIVEPLEVAAGISPDGLKMAARVHRIARLFPRIEKTLVIDDVRRVVPPRVAHLIRVLAFRPPIWLVARSTAPVELGHVWPYLFLFDRVDVTPFSIQETRAFLESMPSGPLRDEMLGAALRLHRLAVGHPRTLARIVEELCARRHDLRSPAGLKLVALHSRFSIVEAELIPPCR